MENKKSPFSQILNVAKEDGKNWQSILLGILLFFVEVVAAYFCFWKDFPLLIFFIVHLACVAFVILFVTLSLKNRDDGRYPWILLLSLIGAGPFGLGGFLILSILFPIYCLFSFPFIKWFRDLFPETLSVKENVYERIKIGWDDYSKPVDIVAFKDAFHYGTPDQKKSILGAIVQSHAPIFGETLKQALQDPDNETKVMAAAIVTKMSSEAEEKEKKLLKMLPPEDPQSHLILAKHYDAFAFTGVLDPLREKENRENALYHYQQYLKKEPKDKEVWVITGRLLFRLGRFREVVQWFQDYRKEFLELEATAWSWYLEALYREGDYSNLREEAKKAEGLAVAFPKQIEESINVWSSR